MYSVVVHYDNGQFDSFGRTDRADSTDALEFFDHVVGAVCEGQQPSRIVSVALVNYAGEIREFWTDCADELVEEGSAVCDEYEGE